MRMFARSRWGSLLTAAVSAAVLTACGGADDPPPATLTAADDVATLDWRQSALVDVLANDRASRGALSLTAVTAAPAHGTAVIEGGQLRYTPADGFFGTDSLRYTVRADDGGATATATLQLTVQARLALSGVITDAPVARAAVTLRVGDRSVEVTADDQGRYSAELLSADPTAWVQVTGVSTDGRVRLVSVVGELAGVAAVLPAGSNAIDAAALPALSATHWTTAAAALMARANGGVVPDTPAALAAARGAVDAASQATLAAAVRLVAEQGAELPAGKADTLALLLDEAATEAFTAAQPAFADVRNGLAADLPPTRPVAFTVEAPRRLIFTLSNPISACFCIVELRPGGTAIAHQSSDRRTATWSYEGGLLTVRFDSPFTTYSAQTWTDPATGAVTQLDAEYRSRGFRARLVDGDWSVGSVEIDHQVEAVYTSGPPAGQTLPGFVDTDAGYLIGVRDVGQGLGLAASELVDGVRIAGLPVGEGIRSGTDPSRKDIVRLAADGSARLELSGKDARWSFADGWLTLSFDERTLRATRVTRDAGTGVEVWVVEGCFGAVEGLLHETVAGVIDPALAFTAENATRQWRAEGFYRSNPELYANNVLKVFADGGASGTPTTTRWQIGTGGSLDLVRVRNGVDHPRRWIPIRRTGTHWLVLEVVDFGYAGGAVEWRTNWYRDLGAAIR